MILSICPFPRGDTGFSVRLSQRDARIEEPKRATHGIPRVVAFWSLGDSNSKVRSPLAHDSCGSHGYRLRSAGETNRK